MIADEFLDFVEFERLFSVDLFHAPGIRIVNVNGHLQVAVVDRLNGLSNNSPDASVLLGSSRPSFRIGCVIRVRLLVHKYLKLIN